MSKTRATSKAHSHKGKQQLGYTCDKVQAQYTTVLFNRTSFLDGIATINVNGNYFPFNYSETPESADTRAIRCDWYAVEKDFNDAFESFFDGDSGASTLAEANEQ